MPPDDESDDRGRDVLWTSGPFNPGPAAPAAEPSSGPIPVVIPAEALPAAAPWTLVDAGGGLSLPRAAAAPATPFATPVRPYAAALPLPPVAPARRATRSKTARVVRGVLAMLVALAVAGLAVVLVRGDFFERKQADAVELPRFAAAPPVYGTATVDVTLTGVPEPFRMTMVSNSTSTALYAAYLPESPTYAGYQMIANDSATFAMAPGDTSWTLVEHGDEATFGAIKGMIGVTTFADWIPDVLREYTSVSSDTTEVLDGRSLRRLEMIVASTELRNEHPEDYAAWLGADPNFGPSTPPMTNVVLSFDDQGIVRKMESTSSVDGGATIKIVLVSYAPETFAPEFPTTYNDALSGEVVSG